MAIHLLNPLWDASGGSEWRTLSLFQVLADHTEVALWTEYEPDAALRGRFPIREMLKTGSYPTSGTFVFVGVYWEIGAWVAKARPDRTIIVYNVIDPKGLETRIEQLREYGIDRVELRFASPMMAGHANGRSGTVEFSPIDLEALSPRPKASGPAVVVGRHSRDVRFKHHPDDPDLYRSLARDGMAVRILGGTCLAEELAGAEGIELLPAGSVAPSEFLNGLDVFFYRTDPTWTETYGRVVAEAMACGLPCVVERGGGYEGLIDPGENGFVFDDAAEAQARIEALALDPELRRRVGEAARRSVEELYARENLKLVAYYLGS